MMSPVVILAVAAAGWVEVVEAIPAPPPPPPPGDYSRPLVPIDRASWATVDDYPEAALREAGQGHLTVNLEVSEEGKVTDCTVEYGSGSSDIDATTCRLLSDRARFCPALDRSGSPIPGTFTQMVRWRVNTRTQQWTFRPKQLSVTRCSAS